MTKSLSFVERSLTGFWQRLENACSNDVHSLGIFRIIWGMFILLFYAPYSTFVCQAPQAFYNPPVVSLANLSAGFPPGWLMLAGDLARIWLAVLITLGIKTRICAVVFCLLTFIFNNFEYSFGKIDHDALVWAVALCLAFTDWGVSYALVPDRRIHPKVAARALATAGFLIAFAMFTAGFAKARWINLDLSTSGFLRWFYTGYYTLDRRLLLASLVPRLPLPLLKAFDYAAVAFELSPFLFLLAGRAGWRTWILVATVFHLANALLLNIPFYIHVLIYLPFVALSRLFGKYSIASNATKAVFSWRTALIFVPIVLAVIHTAQRLKGGGSQFLFIEGNSVFRVTLYVSVVLLVLCSVMIAIDLVRCLCGAEMRPAGWRPGVPADTDNGPGERDR